MASWGLSYTEGAHSAAQRGSGGAAKGLWAKVNEQRDDDGWLDSPTAEKGFEWQSSILRDIFGSPFRPLTLAPVHRAPTVVSLARAAYDERQLPSGELDPRRLAVLADALEEAGSPAELVSHLRSPGPHVRGCWVVDLCLGLN